MMRPFLTLAAACLTIPLAASNLVVGRSRAEIPARVALPAPQSAGDVVQARRREDVAASSRRALLAEFRNSGKIRSLIGHGLLERETVRHAATLRGGAGPF
jgi:hypothetical protein